MEIRGKPGWLPKQGSILSKSMPAGSQMHLQVPPVVRRAKRVSMGCLPHGRFMSNNGMVQDRGLKLIAHSTFRKQGRHPECVDGLREDCHSKHYRDSRNLTWAKPPLLISLMLQASLPFQGSGFTVTDPKFIHWGWLGLVR